MKAIMEAFGNLRTFTLVKGRSPEKLRSLPQAKWPNAADRNESVNI